MKHRPATDDEKDECKIIYRKLARAVNGHHTHAVLNTLCFVLADVGVELEVGKEVFLEEVIKQLGSAYDMCYLSSATPQGEA